MPPTARAPLFLRTPKNISQQLFCRQNWENRTKTRQRMSFTSSKSLMCGQPIN